MTLQRTLAPIDGPGFLRGLAIGEYRALAYRDHARQWEFVLAWQCGCTLYHVTANEAEMQAMDADAETGPCYECRMRERQEQRVGVWRREAAKGDW